MDTKDNIKIKSLSFLFKEAPLKIILSLKDKDNFASKTSKETYVTYSYAETVFKKLEETGLIERKKEGRTRTAILTKKGKEIQAQLLKLKNIMGEK